MLTRKFIYDMPPETYSMFLNFISIFNDPKPNIDTLKESDIPEVLGHNKDRIQRFSEIGKIKLCCYHS